MNKLLKIYFIILLSFIIPVIFISESFANENKYIVILEKGKKINPDLKTFKATLYIKANVAGIPIPFFARLYYKKPDRLKLKIPMAPGILKNKKGLFQDAVPRSFSGKDYKGEILKEVDLNKKVRCYLLKLIPRKKCKIKKVHLWVDKKSYLTPKTQVFYNNGSGIVSLQSFRKEGKYVLPDKQRINFNLPKFKASAFIQYKKYEINVPVDDVFEKKK
ncbi:MAG: outer membrane lipoprotein-sorting protein [Candidatus Eremiobacteraeota bacterium]|nr:outer membrane lipoprotein-sorting protein [Candidatus Eremiobacteraeota bacterium]